MPSSLDTLAQASANARLAVETATQSVADAESQVVAAKHALNAAHDRAATADLEHGNAIRAAQQAEEARQLNIELAQRNVQRMAELVLAGELTPEEIANG